MTETASPVRAERSISILSGLTVLAIAATGIAWTMHWTVLWQQNPDALPGEMLQLLLVAAGTSVVVAFGAWRLLLLGITEPLLGWLSAGRLVLAAMAMGILAGAFVV